MSPSTQLHFSLALFGLPFVALLLAAATQVYLAVQTRTAWETVRMRYRYAPSQMRKVCRQVRKGRCPAWFALPADELAYAYVSLNKSWRWRGPGGLVVAALAAVIADLGVAAGALATGAVPFWEPLVSYFLLLSVAAQLLGVQLHLNSRDRWATAVRRRPARYAQG